MSFISAKMRKLRDYSNDSDPSLRSIKTRKSFDTTIKIIIDRDMMRLKIFLVISFLRIYSSLLSSLIFTTELSKNHSKT